MTPVIFRESVIRAVADFGCNLLSVGRTHTAGNDWRFNKMCREMGVRKGGTMREAAPVIIQLVLSGLLGRL